MGNKALLTAFLLLLAFSVLGCTQKWEIQNSMNYKYGIFIMNSDGKNVMQIYGSNNSLSSASVSPDGTKIIFCEMEGGIEGISTSEIAVINIDGTGYRKLTDNDYMDFQPVWISDSEILFVSNPSNTGTDIYTMNLDGYVLNQLTDTIGISEADPDVGCGKVVFTREHSVWMMYDDGTNLVQMTNPYEKGLDIGVQFPIGDYDPNFSPDCTKIVFERLVGAGKIVSGVNIGDYDIYVYDTSSGTETEISGNDIADFVPKWGVNGIIFVQISDVLQETYDIYFIKSDGTERHRITGNDPINFIENGCSWFGDSIVFTAQFFSQ